MQGGASVFSCEGRLGLALAALRAACGEACAPRVGAILHVSCTGRGMEGRGRGYKELAFRCVVGVLCVSVCVFSAESVPACSALQVLHAGTAYQPG